MVSFLNPEEFELSDKDRSIEALEKWRSAAWLVKNPRRRFRWAADLVKRKHAEDKRRKIQVPFLSLFLVCFEKEKTKIERFIGKVRY